MRESTSVFQTRTINRSVDRFPEEVKVRITLYAPFFWVTEYFRNNSLHSSITKYILMLCKLVKSLIFLVLCLYLDRRSLCHCKTPVKTDDIVHI